ncbi:MAG: hypothetical protein Q9191_004181 [Dirinaria sp. TL-2023a]
MPGLNSSNVPGVAPAPTTYSTLNSTFTAPVSTSTPTNPCTSDTPSAFQSYGPFTTDASAAPVPAGYSQSFSNLHDKVSKTGYIGYFGLGGYDTITCAAYCNDNPTCGGFNVYIERNVGEINGEACPSPDRRARYFCTLWNAGVNAKEAVATAASRGRPGEVVAGSNGYSRVY